MFVASGQELQAHRRRVDDTVRAFDDTASQNGTPYRVKVWLHELHGTRDAAAAQSRINPEFDQSDVIVVLVGNRIGDGTRSELERAFELRGDKGQWRRTQNF